VRAFSKCRGSSTPIASYNAHFPLKYFSLQISSGNEA
jgi:hypothetical protein